MQTASPVLNVCFCFQLWRLLFCCLRIFLSFAQKSMSRIENSLGNQVFKLTVKVNIVASLFSNRLAEKDGVSQFAYLFFLSLWSEGCWIQENCNLERSSISRYRYFFLLQYISFPYVITSNNKTQKETVKNLIAVK